MHGSTWRREGFKTKSFKKLTPGIAKLLDHPNGVFHFSFFLTPTSDVDAWGRFVLSAYHCLQMTTRPRCRNMCTWKFGQLDIKGLSSLYRSANHTKLATVEWGQNLLHHYKVLPTTHCGLGTESVSSQKRYTQHTISRLWNWDRICVKTRQFCQPHWLTTVEWGQNLYTPIYLAQRV